MLYDMLLAVCAFSLLLLVWAGVGRLKQKMEEAPLEAPQCGLVNSNCSGCGLSEPTRSHTMREILP